MQNAWLIHQKIYLGTLTLTSIASLFWSPTPWTQIVLLAIGVAIVGILHGSIDHRFGRAVIKGQFTERWILPFSFAYLSLAGLMLGLWLINSRLGLLVFLMLAVPHFGYTDLDENRYSDWLYHGMAWSMGTLPIVLPAFFSTAQVTQLFNILMLNGETFSVSFINSVAIQSFWLIISILATFTLLSFFYSSISITTILLDTTERLLLTALFGLAQPLIAFGIYYCVGHSIREGIEISHILNPGNLSRGGVEFLSSAFPLTVLTLLIAFGVGTYLHETGVTLSSNLTVLIFVGLSSLLVPHMFVEFAYDYFPDAQL